MMMKMSGRQDWCGNCSSNPSFIHFGDICPTTDRSSDPVIGVPVRIEACQTAGLCSVMIIYFLNIPFGIADVISAALRRGIFMLSGCIQTVLQGWLSVGVGPLLHFLF